MENKGSHQGETGQQHGEAAGKETQHDGKATTQLKQDHQRQHKARHTHRFHIALGSGIAADLAPARHYEHQRQQYTTRQQRYIFHLVHFIFLVCVTSPLTASG